MCGHRRFGCALIRLALRKWGVYSSYRLALTFANALLNKLRRDIRLVSIDKQDALAHQFTVMKQSLEAQFQISVSDWDGFTELFSLKRLNANEDWVKAGEHCQQFGFIVSGLIRVYYIDHAGNEANEGFYEAGQLIGPISSMVSNDPCQFYIQALEPSELFIADYRQFHELAYDKPEWLRFEIKFMQQIFLKSARRDAKLLMGSAEQRYRWFCKEHPDLLKRIPQYQIASYLGVTPVTLSRLRKKG